MVSTEEVCEQNNPLQRNTPISTRSERLIIVTGMHRTGTSCVTGLLGECGFSLGTSHPFMLENKPLPENPRGHFEINASWSINSEILKRVGGAWDRIPQKEAIQQIGLKAAPEIRDFGAKFNGEIVKDPRFCLTLDVWRREIPSISDVVLCVRHPLAVLASLNSRREKPANNGIALWYHYYTRVLESVEGLNVHIVNFDNFSSDVSKQMKVVCNGLGKDLTEQEVKDKIGDFYSEKFKHHESKMFARLKLPEKVQQLYDTLLDKQI